MSKTMIERIGLETYSRHYARMQGKNVYVSPEYLEILEGIRDIELYMISDNGRTIGLFPLVSRKKLFIRFSTQPPLTPFFNMLYQDIGLAGQKQLDYMTRIAAAYCNVLKTNYHIFNVPQYFNIEDIRPFIWAGAKVKPLYTYIMKAGIPENTDRRVKNISEGIVDDKPDFRNIFSMLKAAYGNARMPVKEHEFMHICSKLHSEGMLCVHRHDDAVCGILKDEFNKTIYEYFIAGRDTAGLAAGIAQSSLYAGMQFDLQGANTKSIARYKSLLNPEIRQYFTVYRKPW